MVKSGTKITIGFVAGFVWLVFIIMFLWSYADGFTLLENLVVVFFAASRPFVPKSKPDKKQVPVIPHTWMILTTVLLGIAWLVFAIIALVFLDGDYSTYQKLALVVLAAMIVTGPLGAMWVRWAMKQNLVA